MNVKKSDKLPMEQDARHPLVKFGFHRKLIEKRGFFGSTFNEEYHGFLRTPRGAYRTKVTKEGNVYRFYLQSPPPGLRRHTHYGCFRNLGQWTSVHFVNGESHPTNAVISIQRILTEAERL